jgi:hypothetical protein
LIEAIGLREARHVHILQITLIDRDGLSFFEGCGTLIGADGNLAKQNLKRCAVAKRVDASFGALRDGDLEGRCDDGERVLPGEVGVKGSGALRQSEMGNAAAIGEA